MPRKSTKKTTTETAQPVENTVVEQSTAAVEEPVETEALNLAVVA